MRSGNKDVAPGASNANKMDDTTLLRNMARFSGVPKSYQDAIVNEYQSFVRIYLKLKTKKNLIKKNIKK